MDTKRFHSPHYKQQIRANRTYRRNAEPRPEGALIKFLDKIGLGSRWTQAGLVLLLGLLVYLAYFAPFLKIRAINIEGATPDETAAISTDLQNYFQSTKYHPLPQRNIFLFSKSAFANYLVKNDFKISSVSSVQKKYFHTVAVAIIQRVPAFTLETAARSYVLNSDGAISAAVEPGAQEQFPKIVLEGTQTFSLGDQVLNAQRYQFIDYLQQNFKSKTGLGIDHFELLAEDSNQMHLVTDKGFKLYFDMTQDPADYLNKFLAIWSSLSPEQQNKLFYADMRFKNNAYVCYKGDKCAQ